MESMLILKNLWSAVITPTPTGVSEAALAEFQNKDTRAKAIIILNIEDTHLYMSQNFSTSKELWDHLKGYFQAKSLSRHASLCRQLTNVEKSREESVAEYFSRAKTLYREILEIDSKAVSNLTFINIVLNGLTEEYSVAVQLLHSQNEDLTFEKIVAPIVNVEQMLKNKASVSGNPSSTALLSKNFTKKQKAYCKYCKKQGHNCWRVEEELDRKVE